MDGFTKLPKMQHFKVGGSVKPKAMCYGGKAMKKGGEVDAADIKQDKAIVKKAFVMHDKQEHPGEKTDLSKLKKGGRAKKEVGTVKKFKCGGGVYGAKKTDSDIKNIDAAKECKPKNISGVKKFQVGGSVLQDLMQAKELNRLKNAKRLGPTQQAQFAAQEQQQTPAMTGLGQQTATPAPAQMPNVDQMGSATGVPAQKRGGKVKKGC
jgi:hypothetical protein